MGQCFPTIDTMKIFVFLSILSLAYSAPAPQEDALEVAPEAGSYIHEEIEALPYVHEEVAYEHEEPEQAAALPVIPQPVLSYAVAPVPPVAVTNYAALPKAAEAPGGAKFALLSPFNLLAGYSYGYRTGCVNSVGSVVPCHL